MKTFILYKIFWVLTTYRKFTVKSLYRQMIIVESGFPQKFLCNFKVPPVVRNKIPTSDNFLSRVGKVIRIVCFMGKTRH